MFELHFFDLVENLVEKAETKLLSRAEERLKSGGSVSHRVHLCTTSLYYISLSLGFGKTEISWWAIN